MWIRLSAAGDDGANVSISGSSARRRGERGGARLGVARVGAVDHDDRAARKERRQLRQRREVHDPDGGGDLLRRRARPVAPGAQHLGVALVGEEHEARVHVGVRVEAELHRGDDAEVAAAAAQRPEELRVVLGGRAHALAGGGDELDRGDAVGREAVLAGQPAQAAAERVADDADVGRGAREREEAVRGRRLGDLEPERAGLDAGRLRRRVDLDAAQLLRGDEDGLLERGDRRRVVAGALRGELEAVAAGEGDERDDVVARRRERDVRGALVDGEVPGAAGERPSRAGAGETNSPVRTGMSCSMASVFSMRITLPAAGHRGDRGRSLSLPERPAARVSGRRRGPAARGG